MRTYSQKPCSLSIRQQISWECWFCDAKQTSSVDILQIYGTCQKIQYQVGCCRTRKKVPTILKQTHLQEVWLIAIPVSQGSWIFIFFVFLVPVYAFCIIRIGFCVFVGFNSKLLQLFFTTVDFRRQNKDFISIAALPGWG